MNEFKEGCYYTDIEGKFLRGTRVVYRSKKYENMLCNELYVSPIPLSEWQTHYEFELYFPDYEPIRNLPLTRMIME